MRRRSQSSDRKGSQAPAATAIRKKPSWLLLLAIILGTTFSVYIPSLDNEFTNWDDNHYVTENTLLARPDAALILTTPVAGNYHPLTIGSLALNYRISGFRPGSYHWLNLFLHLANTALVFLFLRALSGPGPWTAAVTALFFGIHPMHVESVAWIAARKDVLYAFFYLLALIAYVRYLDAQRRPGKAAWIGAAFAAFVLSAASKPAAVVLPLTLLAIDYFRRRQFTRAAWLEKIPFFAVSIAVGLLTWSAQHSAGAIIAERHRSLAEKMLFAAYGSVMYVVKLFLPIGLSAVYPQPLPNEVGAGYYACLAALVVLLPATIYLFRRVRPVLFGLAFFFINVVLVLQFVSVGNAVMADRYTYLPYVGLFFALSWWLDERPAAPAAARAARPVIGVVLVALAPLCAVQTWRRCDVWQNSGTLWNDTIAKYPGRVLDAYNNRGLYHFANGRVQEALADYDRALAINPAVARVWVNKGEALTGLNQNDAAYACFERAIALKPDSPEALNNRGAIRYYRGDARGAVSDFSAAIAVNPRFRAAYSNRALAYASAGEHERSLADRRKTISLDPENPRNYLQWGSVAVALSELRRHREAVAAFDEAIRTAPPGDVRTGTYHLQRSRAWRALGDRARALEDARAALRLGTRVEAAYLRELGG